jgi:hypothetical protein
MLMSRHSVRAGTSIVLVCSATSHRPVCVDRFLRFGEELVRKVRCLLRLEVGDSTGRPVSDEQSDRVTRRGWGELSNAGVDAQPREFATRLFGFLDLLLRPCLARSALIGLVESRCCPVEHKHLKCAHHARSAVGDTPKVFRESCQCHRFLQVFVLGVRAARAARRAAK